MNLLDLAGQRFGRLIAMIALERVSARRNQRERTRWRCRCGCGRHTTVEISNLRGGQVQSCGCLCSSGTYRHGAARRGEPLPEYVVWLGMRQRCSNPKHVDYKNYGGRGIVVCRRWNRFENFLADMGRRPVGHSIERVDVNGNYTPADCKWIPTREQSKNKRSLL